MEQELQTKDIVARKFAIGQLLDIEIQDSAKTRFQSPLIGMKEGKYLLAELPSLTRHGNLRDQLLPEQELIVRTICEKTTGECLGFKSFIYGKLRVPDQLLFLSFPNNVQIHELRNEKRLLVTQQAQLVMGELLVQGMMIDLSGGGCRFEFADTATVEFTKGALVGMHFLHPETGVELKHECKICSVRNYQNLVSLGMAFEKSSKSK